MSAGITVWKLAWCGLDGAFEPRKPILVGALLDIHGCSEIHGVKAYAARVIWRCISLLLFRGQSAAHAPIFFRRVMKENIQRLRFDVGDFGEVVGDTFDQLVFLFLGL